MFEKAVENIASHCLRLQKSDRFIIISDRDRETIGTAIYERAQNVCQTKILFIEDFVTRPAKEFPELFIRTINNFQPTVSLYAATGQEGELQVFRFKLIELLTQKLNCRHGHMINVDETIMQTGMSMDYSSIYQATHTLYSKLKNAKKIQVTDPHGTNLRATFNPLVHWKADDGVPLDHARWCNLPAGEVFTCPASVDGTVVAWEVGDYFSERYGVLESPLTLTLTNSFITRVECANLGLQTDFKNYISKYENGNRVGEFAIGCLLGLEHLIGNLLQDEKFPGVHMAFGHPYPEATGMKDWDAPSHVDVIPLNVTATVDGEEILKDGKFTIELG